MRRTKEDVAFETDFLEGVLERNPAHVECLKVLAENYTLSGRYREGLKMDLRLARLCPSDAVVYYNLACSYSLMGRLKNAARTLSRAISLGYRDLDHIRTDPDLAALRDSRVFMTVMEGQNVD
jgi:tetratricopeptide (TPR) repeat protein